MTKQNTGTRMIRLAVGLASGAAALIAMMAAGATPVAAAPEPSRVTICHFDGHAGDFVTRSAKAAGTGLCDYFGGTALEVAAQGCENGHKAAPFNFPGLYPGETYTCQDGHLQHGASH